MVELSLVQAADHVLPRVAERLQHFQGLFVDVVGVEILGHGAVVHVRELAFVHFFVEEKVVDINQVYISDLLLDFLVATDPSSLLVLRSVVDGISTPLCDFTNVGCSRACRLRLCPNR
mgnify:CR=1 FL=1